MALVGQLFLEEMGLVLESFQVVRGLGQSKELFFLEVVALCRLEMEHDALDRVVVFVQGRKTSG